MTTAPENPLQVNSNVVPRGLCRLWPGLGALPLLIATSFVAILCSPAQAQAIKCTAADGKVTYSNVACPYSTASERTIETSGNTLDGSSLREQAQKNKAAAAQAEATERERAAFEAGSRQQAAKQEAQSAAKDEAAYDNCVRSVERTGAYATDRARQVATCHGADVKPEPPVVVLRPTVRTMGPARITSCNGNQCSDDAGQRYFKQQGTGLLREDGKFCQLAVRNTVRCP